jgi:hypothetical protein
VSARDHARAAFIALHLVAVTLVALPAPVGATNRATWKEPTVQAELAVWRSRLASVGVDLEPDAFEDALHAWAVDLLEVRAAVLTPFLPYYRYAGTSQSWRMFVAPHTHPARLEVAVERGGAWVTVFRERDPEATWNRRVFTQDRARSLIFRLSWANYRSEYVAFAEWVGRRAAVDFPDATKVRVRFMKRETPSAAEARAGEGEPEKPTQARTITLKAAT